MKTKAFSYIRMSLPRQMLGDSMKRQEELAKEYAAEHDLELSQLKIETMSGWTGANRLQGTLSGFLAKIGTHAVPPGSYLLVESLDRISRENVLEAQALFLSIINAGVTIVTLSRTGKRVYEREAMKENPFDLIISMLEMVRANAESELKSVRLKGAWKTKREKIASGVKMTAACPAWFTKDGNDYVEIPEKVALVRRIFEELASGLGKDKIAQRLNDEGKPCLRETNKGAGWHASTIHHLVHAKNVLGLYQPCVIVHEDGKKRRVPMGEPIEGYYPPIIGEELYQRVVTAMAGRRNEGSLRNGGRKGARLSNLFGGGLAECASCGGPMLFKRGDKRSPSYLRCGIAVRRAGCDNVTHFQYEPFEATLLATLVDLDVSDHAAPKSDTLANDLAAANRLLAANQTAIKNQVAAINLAGAIPAILDQIATLRQEEPRLRALVADLQMKVSFNAFADRSAANGIDWRATSGAMLVTEVDRFGATIIETRLQLF